MCVIGGHCRAIGEHNRRRLSVRRGSLSRVGPGARDNSLPLPDLPARQRRSVHDMGRIR